MEKPCEIQYNNGRDEMKESRVKAWRFKHKERIMEITSLTNAKVKQWAKYKEK